MICHALVQSLVLKTTWKWEDPLSKHTRTHLEIALSLRLLPRGSVLLGSILFVLNSSQPSACMIMLLLVWCFGTNRNCQSQRTPTNHMYLSIRIYVYKHVPLYLAKPEHILPVSDLTSCCDSIFSAGDGLGPDPHADDEGWARVSGSVCLS